MTLGDILNKPFLSDRQANQVADNVALTAGMLVYQDGSNGVKVVPTSSQPAAQHVRFLEKAVDNTLSDHAKGARWAETYKKGALVVGKVDGAISVGSRCRASTSVAGAFAALAAPSNATATIANTTTSNEIDAVRDYGKFWVATYLRHLGEGETIGGTDPTDAADTETNAVFRME